MIDKPIVFSCPQPLNSVGPSRPLTRIHDALKAHSDQYIVLEPGQFPQMRDPNGLGQAIGPAFDDVAAHRLTNMELPGLYLGGGGASYSQMNVLEGLNIPRGTLWFSSHWKHAQRVLTEEYQQAGIQAPAIHPYVSWRAQIEQEESDYMIVPSEHCKNTYPKSLHDKIHVAEFGVDANHYPIKPKRTHAAMRILFPATNPYRKGLRYALQALHSLPADKYQVTVTGTQIAPMDHLGLPPIVSTGWVPDQTMDKFYGDHDVLLLPSLEEGQALATLEAAASGLPLIVTKETGIPIEDGKQGFVVPSRDPAAIRTALQTLQQDENLHRQMSNEARKFAEARTWEAFQNRVIQILEQVTKA